MGERALLTVLKLSLTARWRRFWAEANAHRALSFAILAAVATSVLIVMSVARTPAVRDAIEWATKNEFLVGLVASLYSLLFVARTRAQLRQERSASWLIATPISSRAFAVTAAIRITIELVLQAATVATTILALASINDQPLHALGVAAGALAAGMFVGAVLGTLWPLRQGAKRNEESRFVRKVRAMPMTPSLAGLSRWPIAKAIAWHRPENSRVLFILAALSVPVGTPAFVGLAILAVWTLASYLLAVVRAVPVVAREASIWLRPTSLSFSAFAGSIGTRALMHQACGTALLGSVFVLLGAHIGDVLYFSGLWLGMTAMIGTIALRQSYLALPSFGRTILSVLVVLITESRARGFGLPLALVVMGFHMRGVRERT
jgi:hypothetical protein